MDKKKTGKALNNRTTIKIHVQKTEILFSLVQCIQEQQKKEKEKKRNKRDLKKEKK